MPDRPKTKASSYRFTPEEVQLMDHLADHLAAVRETDRYTRTDVLRLALRRLAETELDGRKNSGKTR